MTKYNDALNRVQSAKSEREHLASVQVMFEMGYPTRS